MIEIRHLKKSYKSGDETLEILKGIHLTIQDGEFVAIMGPSGSGKSTLMNILGLLDTPSGGSYLLNGVEVSRLSDSDLAEVRRREIGFIFQQFHLLPRLTAEANVALPLLYSKHQEDENRAQDLMVQVGLGHRIGHHPNELSGGQQQRVAIARSLINRPKMILADEPTGNLDSKSEVEIMKILRELHSQGITVVIVTHEEEIGQQADRLIRMRDGVILSDERKVAEVVSGVAEYRPFIKTPPTSWFEFFDYFVQGFETLLANKVRTALSMLGILIGVAAVIAMLAIGRGAQLAMEEKLASLGSNLLVIKPGQVKVGGVTQDAAVANRLAYEDIHEIKSLIGSVKEASGVVNGRVQVTAQAKNWNTVIQGASPSWAAMHASVPDFGRFFSDQENEKKSRVAVIGLTVQKRLFGEASAIGEMVKINRVNFQVIGVLPEKGSNGTRDQDDIVIVPLLTAMHRLLGKDYIDLLEVEIDEPENIPDATQSLRNVISAQHKVPLSQQSEAFQIRNMAEVQAAMEQNSSTMSLLLSSIAAISLLVGGIGIMNIMLISVTERTKEIGLRKALGAKPNDILAQFLSESVVVSVVGGLAGLLLGWVLTELLGLLTGWATSISWQSVVWSFLFSAFVGVVFGVYPAQKASKLNPIQALRSDN